MSDSKKPIDKLQEGMVKSAIWENESRDGNTFHSATFSKTYKDKDGKYRDTTRFTGDDVLKLSNLARRTHDRMTYYREKAREERAQDGQSYADQRKKAASAKNRTHEQEYGR